MSKRLLYLSDTQLLAYQIKGKTLTEIQRFQPSAEGQTHFVDYLSEDPKTPIICLVDTVKEEYQTTHLPHVLGRDRRDLLSNKMRRLFDYTPYTHAVVQGRERHGRGDDRVLFLALSQPTLLQPWLELITVQKVPLAGILSVPLLSQLLLKNLTKATHLLLVTQTPSINEHNPFGLRQSFFVNQQFQFSRLIPVASLSPEEYANYVFAEILKTQRYLESARLLPTDLKQPLSIVILSETAYLAALDHFSKENLRNSQIHLLDSQDFAHRLGLRTDETPLCLHHFVAYQWSRRGWSSNHYARPLETRYFFYRKVRLALYLTAFFLFAGAATASYWILNQALQKKQEGEKIAKQTVDLKMKLEKLNAQVPPDLPLNIVLFRNVVDIGRHLQALHLFPQPTLEKLSGVLTRHPKIFLTQLEWGIGNTAEEIFDERPNPPPPPPLPAANKPKKETSPKKPSGSTLFGNKPSRPSPVEPKPELPEHFIEAIRLHGKIYPFGGNYRDALHLFEEFVEDLRQQRTDFFKINELLSPEDSKNAFQGQIGSATEEQEAPFTVEILIEHSYFKMDNE